MRHEQIRPLTLAGTDFFNDADFFNVKCTKNAVHFLTNFYTTGYTGKRVEELPALLDFYDAILADIRFAPVSRHLQWTKSYLSLMLKERYRHVAALGNRNYKTHGGAIRIHNLEIGIRLIESWKTNVILLCACAELENCHRRIVRNELEKRGHEVQEITSWDTSQPSLFGR